MTHPSIPHVRPPHGAAADSPRLAAARAWSRRALPWVAHALVLALLAQVLTAGLATFASPLWWQRHRAFVHLFEWLSPLALALAVAGRASRPVVTLAGATVLLLAAQYTTAQLRLAAATRPLAALHAVTAVILVWTAVELSRRSRR